MSAPMIEVQPDAATLATAVAGELLSRIEDIQAAGHVPQICLTGGTIAEAIHREVARLGATSGVDWNAVAFWFGDERFVPRDSADRNERQAREAFLDALGATRVYPVPASDQVATVEDAAASYADTVRAEGTGAFDIVMLGMGPDGHVASLFPGHPAAELTDAIAVPVHDSPKPPPERVSLTFEALDRAKSVWFLVSGSGKADAAARALAPEGDVRETPARGVTGTEETVWFLDRDAASAL